jgi:DNA-directed RNA polymerase subunit RPC12/RpoP
MDLDNTDYCILFLLSLLALGWVLYMVIPSILPVLWYLIVGIPIISGGLLIWRWYSGLNKPISVEKRTVPQPKAREVPAAKPTEPAKRPAEEPARTGTVSVLRGCQAVGGGFEYKVKVKNNTAFVINNVIALVVAYPQDCMDLTGSKLKTVSRIEPNGFRSLQFVFTPTKDCVEGQIVASVSYIDHKNQLHTDQAEPYVIRSVCDLMKPLEATVQQFDEILTDMKSASEARTLSWNAPVLFEKTKALLPSRNFHVIEAKSASIGGQFSGTIKGFAKGKYTGKRVAVQLLISGPGDGKETKVVMEALGDDLAMLPTTIDEVSRGIKSWTCMTCGGIISPAEVTKLKAGEPLKCRYCQHTNTIDLYWK